MRCHSFRQLPHHFRVSAALSLLHVVTTSLLRFLLRCHFRYSHHITLGLRVSAVTSSGSYHITFRVSAALSLQV